MTSRPRGSASTRRCGGSTRPGSLQARRVGHGSTFRFPWRSAPFTRPSPSLSGTPTGSASYRKRAKRIGHLGGPEPAFSRSTSPPMELADVYKMWTSRPGAGRMERSSGPAGRAQGATGLLGGHRRQEGGRGESLEEDDLLYYIKARFELGRILHGPGCSQRAPRREGYCRGLGHLQWIEDSRGSTVRPVRPSIISRLLF